jgi:peptidoglycan L-alanyl-D-glutamate endopeptidase CwlK
MRDINKLTPIVKDKAMAFKMICANHGIEIVITSTLRTDAMQRALYAQGRQMLEDVNLLRKIAGMKPISEKRNEHTVTNAQYSMHQSGCAFDFAIVGPEGITWDTKADINDDNYEDYRQAGIIGESLGLTWGGRFKRIYDAAHLEYTDELSIDELQRGSRPSYHFE